MSVYNINGTQLSSVYDVQGTSLSAAYDLNGNRIFGGDTPIEPDDPYISGRTLLFEDSFRGNALNTDNWGYEIGAVRNNELQFYRSTNNVAVEDGKLVITAKRESYLGKSWTSGSITGQGKKSWALGRFEAKIKFPRVSGAFPAFWTLGANHFIVYANEQTGEKEGTKPEWSVPWPQCGEIDIVEHYPGDGNRLTSGAICNVEGGSSWTDIGRVNYSQFDVTDYHIYALEITNDMLYYYVDGNLVTSHAQPSYTDCFKLPQYILLNLAVGSSGGTPASDVTEMKMYVDWVRVYAPMSS